MSETLTIDTRNKFKPRGIVVPRDKQEEEFETLLRLWLNDEIDYQTLQDSLPDQYKSVWKKFLKYLYSHST